VNVLSSTYSNLTTLTTLVLDGNLTIGNERWMWPVPPELTLGAVVDSIRVVNGSTTWGTGVTTLNFNGNGFSTTTCSSTWWGRATRSS